MRPRVPRRLRQAGQVLPIAALLLPVMVAFAVLALDTGYNWADRRNLQSAADQGALAAASDISAGNAAVLQLGQNYAWRDLNQAIPASMTTLCNGAANACTVGPYNGYTITVTSHYSAKNPAYSPNNTVAVDVQHQNPGIGFESFLGFGSVHIAVHAAATSEPGQLNFPFALATRFLDMVGNSAVASYGAVLVGQCSDNGRGDFVDNGANGGIRLGGQSEIDLGLAQDSSGDNTSAQALLLSTPGATCTNPPNTASDGSSNWSGFGNGVYFDPNTTNYNYYYGFNAGPAGCSSSTSLYSTCTASPIGSGLWQDGCWTSGGGSVNIKTSTGIYSSSSGGVGTITPGVVVPCVAGASHEGSFPDSRWPNLPVYSSAADLAGNLGDAPKLTGSANTITAGAGGSTSISADQYFNSANVNTKANLVFAPGTYVFDGSAALLTIGNGASGSLTCSAGTSSHIVNFPGITGCVFVFENGASLSMQSGAINCADSISGDGNCAFEFDGTGSLTFSSGLNATLHPIAYTDAATGATYRMPLVYSTQSNNCLNSSAACAISMSSSGATFDVRGTLYARLGIVSINANAQPVSGQVIADTVELQAGSAAAPGGVAYNGSAVAPAAAPASLIE
jgi:hypothetical protein